MKKVSFVFSGSRDGLMDEIALGLAPDTQLYGANHIGGDFDVTVERIADSFLNKLLGFRLRQAIAFFSVRSADIVIGPSIFFMLPLKRLFGSRGKFIILNMSVNGYLDRVSDKAWLYRHSLNLLRSADMIISLSNLQMKELVVRHGLNWAVLRYVPLGVDMRFYQPVFSGRKSYMLSVGRDNGRDYGTVIDVARRLPQKEFHLVLSRRNIAGIADIPPNIRLFFDISKDNLKRKYREASALLLITHADGYHDGADCSGQTVLLDAFASGLPVIASRKTYLDDYARDGESIVLVDSYDPDGIIEAMKEISPEKGEKMARNARGLVEMKFSSKKMGERLSDLMKSL